MNPAERLHLFPLQIVVVDDGVLVRRGTSRLHVAGAEARDAVEKITALTATGATPEEILEAFEEKTQPFAQKLLEEFCRRRFLVGLADGEPPPPAAGEEEPLDIFYWGLSAKRHEIDVELALRSVHVVGVNALGVELAACLVELGFGRVALIDQPVLRNIDFFDEAGELDPARAPLARIMTHEHWAEANDMPDCLVVTSDFGGPGLMREWNSFCVEAGVRLLPVLLHDLVGYIGPLVVPRETACFECLWLRQNSNLENAAHARAGDLAAFQGQVVDARVPLAAGLVARLGAFEVYRFFARSVPGWRPDRVLEFDLCASTLQARKFLRAPRCPVCGAFAGHGVVALETAPEMPGNPLEA